MTRAFKMNGEERLWEESGAQEGIALMMYKLDYIHNFLRSF
jgi:hypothetical protein